MKRAVIAAVGVLSVLLAGYAGAQTEVRRERPRLFLRAEEIGDLRKRCQTVPEVRAAYEQVRGFAYERRMQSNLWVAPDELSAVLVAYLVEGRDPKLLARARGYLEAFERADGDEWTRPRMLKALAHAYDWLHEELMADGRLALARRMAELVDQVHRTHRHSDYNNHVYLEYGPILYAGLALAGDGVDDEFAQKALAEGQSLLKEHFIPTVNQVGAQGRGGWHESMSYWSFFAYELAHQLEAWRTATGEDLFAACPGLRGAADWFLYCTRPHDGSMAPVADINTPNRWGWQEAALFPLLAARYRDGTAAMAASMIRPDVAAHAWPFVLWFDPAVKSVELASLPTGTLFPGIGWTAMRSSWDKDATWALFTCGDYYAGHEHSDQASFVISRSGNLAIDAGEYGAKATEFHNTLLVGGSQRPYRNDPRQLFGPTVKGSQFDTGDIRAFEENRFFTCVVGDASNAYGAFAMEQRVEEKPLFLRRFLFLKPSTFVVDDLVRAPAAQGDIRWLLHAESAPTISGRQFRIADGGGELLGETLLPDDAVCESRAQTGGRKNLSAYRIDVVPRSTSGEVRFLHVLHTRPAGSASTAQSTVEANDGRLELRVTADGRVFHLTLPPAHVEAGEIRVSDMAGQTLLDRRPLASGVLPYGAEGMRLLERWDSAYRREGPPAWDTGRPASDLVKAVEDGTLRPCRVAELGCGTGTNAIYLAGKGFDVTAIDVAPTALEKARQKAEKADSRVRWVLADVLNLPDLGPFDLIFDRGCYHGVRAQNAREYVAGVQSLSRPGTRLLILAGNANEPLPRSGPPRVSEEQLRGDFSESFDFEWLRETHFDSAEPSRPGALAWSVLLRRRG